MTEGWKRAVRRLFRRGGITVEELAVQFDVSVTAIVDIVVPKNTKRKIGLQQRAEQKRRTAAAKKKQPMRPEDEASLVRLHEGKGFTVAMCARIFGCSEQRVREILSQHGDHHDEHEEAAEVRD